MHFKCWTDKNKLLSILCTKLTWFPPVFAVENPNMDTLQECIVELVKAEQRVKAFTRSVKDIKTRWQNGELDESEDVVEVWFTAVEQCSENSCGAGAIKLMPVAFYTPRLCITNVEANFGRITSRNTRCKTNTGMGNLFTTTGSMSCGIWTMGHKKFNVILFYLYLACEDKERKLWARETPLALLSKYLHIVEFRFEGMLCSTGVSRTSNNRTIALALQTVVDFVSPSNYHRLNQAHLELYIPNSLTFLARKKCENIIFSILKMDILFEYFSTLVSSDY